MFIDLVTFYLNKGFITKKCSWKPSVNSIDSWNQKVDDKFEYEVVEIPKWNFPCSIV